MKTDSSFDGCPPGFLEAAEFLAFYPRFMDPKLPSGLWFCDSAESVQAISKNAVCLKTTHTWDDVSRCKDFLAAFPYIVIVAVDLALRQEMTNELRRRIPDTVFYVAEDKAFRGCASVTELRETHGQKGIDQILLDCIELPVYGLLDLADVTAPDPSSIPSVRSGFPPLDRRIRGFRMGEVSVWTGRRGEGKSTILGQLLLESVDQGFRVCAYSGELKDWKFKYWTSLQAAGPDHVVMAKNPQTGDTVPTVPAAIQAQIDAWWRRRFLLYDIGSSSVHDEDNILRLFNYAHNFYGCEVFLVDNIMTARFRASRDADFYRAQSNFMVQLTSFARKANVHIHVVAHPRKSPQGAGKKHLDNDDVGGIGDITNLADNVFSLERTIKAAEEKGKATEETTALAILKNRMWGDFFPRGQAMQLDFDARSKRFFRRDAPADKRYGWDLQEQVTFEELPQDIPDQDLPFDGRG